MHHFQSVDIGNPAQIVTHVLPIGRHRYVATAGLVLFPGNESSSFLNAKVLLIIYNSPDILPKHLRLDFLSLDVFFRSASPELKQWKEDVRFADKLWYRETVGYGW